MKNPLHFHKDPFSLETSSGERIAYCSADERASLVTYFLGQGELSLLKGDLKGLDLFEKATELDPCNPEIFYRQGLALFEYGSEGGKEKSLLLAGKKFKTALSLYPEYFDAWQAWGNALVLLGITYKEHHYFLEAEDKFKKAIQFSEGKPLDLLADIFWDYGNVWAKIAEQSEEAIDLQMALEAFQKTCQYQENLPAEFWNDFGKTSLQLALLIGDVRLNVKAINCFKHAVSLSISCAEGWKLLAQALQILYFHTHDEDHFNQANDCFSTATHLQPGSDVLFLEWASFLCESGRKTKDIKRLRECLEKCQLSYLANSLQSQVIAIWAEALALIGELSDRLDLIYEAQNKISEALDLSEEEDPEIWYSYGMCLNSFGEYFGDIDYYYQAIEKFQHGLSIDRTRHRHWYAIAKTYSVIGNLESDIDSYEKAVRFYAKAIDLNSYSLYIFDDAVALSRLGEMKQDQKYLEEAVVRFDQALNIQKNAVYIHPEWLFQYAVTLDMLGDFYEDESFYSKGIELLSHVLMIDPDFPQIHHKLALIFSHLGELSCELDHFHRAIHHYRLACKHEEENDQVILDWGVSLINVAQHSHDPQETALLYREAESKMTQAARLGSQQAYYHLACLYSLLGNYDRSFHFLEKSHESKSLPPIEEVLEDEWLDGLRMTSLFQGFLALFSKGL